MTRAQRKRHRLIWTLLGPALIALIVAAVLVRPATPLVGPMVGEHR